MHSGRSNPRQLLVADHTADALASICAEMRQAHKDRFGRNDDLVIGLQLTHSGRYSHPNKPVCWSPKPHIRIRFWIKNSATTPRMS